jgi:hypothetical protein
MRYVPPKRRYEPTRPHCVTTQNTAVRIQKLRTYERDDTALRSSTCSFVFAEMLYKETQEPLSLRNMKYAMTS